MRSFSLNNGLPVTSYPKQPTHVKFLHEGWYYNGVLHRLNGPAAIYDDGTQKWTFSQRRGSRNNEPAVVYDNGRYAYFTHRRSHMKDGMYVTHSKGKQYIITLRDGKVVKKERYPNA